MKKDSSGFKNIVLKPVMSGDLPYASASIRSVRGMIVSSWKRNENELKYSVEIPGNTSAEIYIPKNSWNKIEITESGNIC